MRTFPENIAKGVTYVQVRDTNSAGIYGCHYGDPSQNLKLRNYKMVNASLLYQLFKKWF
jgi:UDP-N-acetylmuramoyl-L-alanyl-D-glutamate--2,6-diaminopimelate ligase